MDPYGIMREVEDGAFLLGTAGTDPLFIRNYFLKNGYDAQIYFTRDDVERNAPQSDACIWYMAGMTNRETDRCAFCGVQAGGWQSNDVLQQWNWRYNNETASRALPGYGPISPYDLYKKAVVLYPLRMVNLHSLCADEGDLP